MVLFRGRRCPNGRCDVVVTGHGGEAPLASLGKLKTRCSNPYDWGKKHARTTRLATHILDYCLDGHDCVPDLVEEFSAQWVEQIVYDNWAMSMHEVTDWVISELWCRLETLRANPLNGGVPCPSEN